MNRGMLYEKMCFQLPGCSGYICLVGYGTYNDLIMMIPDKVKNKNPVKVKQYDAGYEYTYDAMVQ